MEYLKVLFWVLFCLVFTPTNLAPKLLTQSLNPMLMILYKLYLAFPLKDLDDGLAGLGEDPKRVAGWCSVNQFLINPDKTQFILFLVLTNFCAMFRQMSNFHSSTKFLHLLDMLRIWELYLMKPYPILTT